MGQGSAHDVNRRKRRAAALSVGSNTMLVVAKLVVGAMTGSVAVVSEAVHSAMDLVAAVIALVAVSLSGRPPDADHPHGHGKIEDLSGAVEALLIFGAVVFIGYEAIDKLLHGGEVKQIYLGAAVMGGSAAVNVFVSWYLQRVGRQTDSAALLADAAHLRTDVYTSAGVVVGLLLVHFTGVAWLDPVTALTVALLIVWEAWQITRRSVGYLLDEGLPEAERQVVERVIRQSGLSFHQLRSRKSGSTRKIDLHLDVSPKATVEQIHTTCDDLEREIVQALPGAQVLIHPEPLLELDGTHTVEWWMARILEQHSDLFRSYSDLHVHEHGEAMHISLRLQVDGDLSVSEVDRLRRHLTEHVTQHVPDAHVYISPEPAERA
jgi:cation diffusion facilitator family transporter